jgi:hypothetical protein
MSSITLSPQEIEAITGYRRPAEQLKVLHSRGFYRAAILNGRLVLERAHYDAVCAGRVEPARPKVKVPTLKAAA